MKIAVKSWLKESFSILEKHWFKLLSASILRTLLATLASSLAFALTVNYTYWNLLVALLVNLLVWSALETGFLKMVLCASRGQAVHFSQLFSGLKLTPIFFIFGLAYALATGFGIVALIVPGIFICVRFSVTGLILVDKSESLSKSLKESLKLTLGYSRLIAPLFLIGATLYFSQMHIQFIVELFATIALVLLYLRMNENASEAQR